MSTGLVVCSICKKEVHQDGKRDLTTGRAAWHHCSRFHNWTPICKDAMATYPQSRQEIVGLFCQADGRAPDEKKKL